MKILLKKQNPEPLQCRLEGSERRESVAYPRSEGRCIQLSQLKRLSTLGNCFQLCRAERRDALDVSRRT
jgi:hypothetical protein